MKQHVTILELNGKYGVISILADDKNALVGNFTQGKSNNHVEAFLQKEDGTLQLKEAEKRYNDALDTSKSRGCKVIYQGKPNVG